MALYIYIYFSVSTCSPVVNISNWTACLDVFYVWAPRSTPNHYNKVIKPYYAWRSFVFSFYVLLLISKDITLSQVFWFTSSSGLWDFKSKAFSMLGLKLWFSTFQKGRGSIYKCYRRFRYFRNNKTGTELQFSRK